jgi:23S rRNA (cytidine1920-2'-O)/16S rRNA (cytidine1409-2'-O)-methyltransferase
LDKKWYAVLDNGSGNLENKVVRFDQLITIKGLAESRTKAQYLIENGLVKLNGKVCVKPSKKCHIESIVEIIEELKYVSRAGYKLDGLLKEYKINLLGKTACDIGSSTGGFVDCLLQNGVKKIYAVDVNVDQLHSKLSSDTRVVKIEKNAREISKEDISDELDLITVDVSFISLEKILDNIFEIASDNTKIIALIKPQFETLKTHRGVVKDKNVHFEVLGNVIQYSQEVGLYCEYLTFSKMLGSDGNIEFFGVFSKEKGNIIVSKDDIIRIVETAWEELK